MLRPLVIQTENSVPILEVKIRKMTRDVVGLRLDESQCKQGQLSVSWDILEKNDGGIVQIIYAGSPDINITAQATLEGQKNIIDYSYLRHLEPRLKENLYFPVIMSIWFSIQISPCVIHETMNLPNVFRSFNVPLWLELLNYILGILILIGGVVAIFKFVPIIRHQKLPFEF